MWVNNMEIFEDDLDWCRRTLEPLDVIIIGAGIGGLATAVGLAQVGHNVTILEQARELREVGAGIQISPNAARVLSRLGLLKRVMALSDNLELTSMRRWANNEILGVTPLMPEVARAFKAPYCVCHRADLQRVLLQAAQDLNITIYLEQRITRLDPGLKARVQLASGHWLSSDVVLAADGVKSLVRSQIARAHGAQDEWHHTGDSAYRLLIPRSIVAAAKDEECLELFDNKQCVRWIGPGCHIMGYPIKHGQLYNMVLVHPSKRGTEELNPKATSSPTSDSVSLWSVAGSKAEMLQIYKNWCPLLRRLLSYHPDHEPLIEWPLNAHTALPSWVENQTALVGDACHPQLPYLGQGAAQSIEDAGVLAACFSRTSHVPLALNIYQLLRKSRAEMIQGAAVNTRFGIHLPDGLEQEARDADLRLTLPTKLKPVLCPFDDRRPAQSSRRSASSSESRASSTATVGNCGDRTVRQPLKSQDKWVDQRFLKFMWGTDVMREVCEGWEEFVLEVEAEHVPEWNTGS